MCEIAWVAGFFEGDGDGQFRTAAGAVQEALSRLEVQIVDLRKFVEEHYGQE